MAMGGFAAAKSVRRSRQRRDSGSIPPRMCVASANPAAMNALPLPDPPRVARTDHREPSRSR